MTTTVVRRGRLLGDDVADLLITDGVVAEIGTDLEAPDGADEVDASGLVVLPGLVDLHTHVREPGREDAETVLTGSRAAARGGFTCVHAMANTDPVADTAGEPQVGQRLRTVGVDQPHTPDQVRRLGRAHLAHSAAPSASLSGPPSIR